MTSKHGTRNRLFKWCYLSTKPFLEPIACIRVDCMCKYDQGISDHAVADTTKKPNLVTVKLPSSHGQAACTKTQHYKFRYHDPKIIEWRSCGKSAPIWQHWHPIHVHKINDWIIWLSPNPRLSVVGHWNRVRQVTTGKGTSEQLLVSNASRTI